MPLSPIVFKSFLGVGLTSMCGAITGGVAFQQGLLTTPKTHKNPQAIVIAASESAGSEESSDTNNVSNYQCRLKSSRPNNNDWIDCQVKALAPDSSSKNQTSFETLKANSSSLDSFSTTALNTAGYVFKVISNDTLAALFTDPTSKLEVASKANAPATLATLDVLAAIKADGTLVGKTRSFIGKIETITPVQEGQTDSALEDNSILRCAQTDTTPTTPADPQCLVYEFSTTETSPNVSSFHTTLTFNFPSAAATSFAQHRYYLIQYKDSAKAVDLATASAYTDIYAHAVSSSGTSAASTKIKHIKFKNISPVVITNETPKRVLILKAVSRTRTSS